MGNLPRYHMKKILLIYRIQSEKKHKNGKNVLDWEISVPDRPTGGLYTHPSLKIPILHRTDISLFLQLLCVFSL
jgi:hypothetical protein